MDFFPKIRLVVFAAIAFLFTQNLNANTTVISLGDNLTSLETQPYDSEATIRESLEALKRGWGLTRVWWRGGQQKYFYEYTDLVSDDSVFHPRIWRFFFEYNETVSAAVNIGKDLGLEVWLWTGLFEFGADERAGGNGSLPFTFEHRLRKEHPEWIPVNKYGTRQQGGPIEFCYPEARAAFIKTLKDFLVKEGYDGIVFYTYAENFTTRYLDEFGFSQPIVDEFRKRYGVDIRTEPFDKEAWAALRGEYVTQFLRELKAALQPCNIKVAVQLSCKEVNGEKPRADLPSAWPGVWSKLDKQRIGRILMDWRTWVDEELVNELHVFYPGNVSIAQELIDYCKLKESSVAVSMYLAGGVTDHPDGVKRVAYLPGATPVAIQSGFLSSQISDPVNNFTDPVKTLREGDKWQKRQLLYLASLNRLTLDVNDIAAASEDEDVFVRAMAVRALTETGLQEAVSFIEARLNDNEAYVRCLSVTELGKLCGPDSLKKIFDTIDLHGSLQYNMFAVSPAVSSMKKNGTLGDSQKLFMRNCFAHSNPGVRQSVVYSIASAGLSKEFKYELLYTAANDTDNFCRALAMTQLSENFTIADTYDIFKNNIESTSQTFQVRAAEALGNYGEKRLTDAYKDKVLSLLLNLFNQYGSGNTRADREWGWRIVGNGILSAGSDGEAVLDKLMRETDDRELADIAWRVLYIRQYRNKYVSVTEEQDEIAHRKRPDMSKVYK